MYELPIFPLHTVLFPGMPLQIHIFEERYKQMMQRVLATTGLFGVCLIKTGAEALGPLPEPYPTGCTARVVQVEKMEDGRMNLTAIGDERFRIVRLSDAQPYLTGFVEVAPLMAHHTLALVRTIPALRKQVSHYLHLLARYTDRAKGASESPEEDLALDMSEMQFPDEPLTMIHLAAALLQVAPLEKQPLLEADTASALLEGVQRLYRREITMLPGLITEPPPHGLN